MSRKKTSYAGAVRAGFMPGIMNSLEGGSGPAPGSVSSASPSAAAATPAAPDYQSLIQNDPAFKALQQSISASDIQNAAQRAAATNQALIQFGLIPDFSQLSSLGFTPGQISTLQSDIDPHTAALAAQNTGAGLSTEAQLQQQQNQAMLALRNNLAARGGISSGDDAYRTGLQDQAYQKAQQNALGALLNAINGYQQSYLSAYQQDQGQLANGLSTAEANQASLYPYGVVPAAAPAPAPAHSPGAGLPHPYHPPAFHMPHVQGHLGGLTHPGLP